MLDNNCATFTVFNNTVQNINELLSCEHTPNIGQMHTMS